MSSQSHSCSHFVGPVVGPRFCMQGGALMMMPGTNPSIIILSAISRTNDAIAYYSHTYFSAAFSTGVSFSFGSITIRLGLHLVDASLSSPHGHSLLQQGAFLLHHMPHASLSLLSIIMSFFAVPARREGVYCSGSSSGIDPNQWIRILSHR